MEFAGRTALVTGATAGIGRSIAELLAAEGAHVLVSGRDAARAAQTVDAIVGAGGSARTVIADLTTERGVENLVAATDQDSVDVLVNNAGIYAFASALATDRAAFDAMVDINLRAPFFLTAALGERMVARGSGSIVNVTSVASQVGTATTAAYGATKAAMESLTRAWAAEFGPRGVNVNAVSPGPTHTHGTSTFADGLDASMQGFPAGRAARPEDIAKAVVFVAGSEYAHGTTVVVDGGMVAV